MYSARNMRPRAVHRLTFWLLPLLIARLFVPDGFMVTATAHGLSLTLCPAYAVLPAAADASAAHMHHAGMDHSAHAMHGAAESPDDSGATHHGQHDKVPCPFALAGTGLVCPTVNDFGSFYSLADDVLVIRAEPAWPSRAVLIDRIRGPPFV